MALNIAFVIMLKNAITDGRSLFTRIRTDIDPHQRSVRTSSNKALKYSDAAETMRRVE